MYDLMFKFIYLIFFHERLIIETSCYGNKTKRSMLNLVQTVKSVLFISGVLCNLSEMGV